MLPTLFLSHGAPTLLHDPVPARDFLSGLSASLPRPRAILVVSAHWQTTVLAVTGGTVNGTIHDFHGFPAPFYQIRYPAPGSSELAARVLELLANAGLAGAVDPGRGLDHGAWVPLMLAYPAAEIPVIQLSLLAQGGPADHLRLGQALTSLCGEGILVIGSGSVTHDLRRLRGQPPQSPESSDIAGFAEWLNEALAAGRIEDLLDYRRLAPYGAENHPTEEHLLPLFTALGAAGPGATGRRLHASSSHGILRMDVFAFDTA